MIGDYSYLWSDSSTGMDLRNISAGTSEVRETDGNVCSVTDPIEVKPELDICLLLVDAISPNGDLVNDVWNKGNS